MIRLLSRYFKENIWLVAANVFFVAMQVFFQTVLMMREMKLIVDNGVGRQDMAYIYSSGLKMLGLTLAAGLGTVCASYVSAKIVARISAGIYSDCYRKAVMLPPSDFDHFGASTLLTRTVTDANQIKILVTNIMRSSLIMPVVVVCMLVLIFRINKTIFAIVFFTFALTVFILIYLGSGSRDSFEKLQQKTDRISLLMKEKITGVRTIRAFGNELYEEKKTADADEEARLTAIAANKRINFLSPSSLVLMNWAIVLIYLASSSQLRAGMASVSDLLLVFQYLGYFIACLGVVPYMVNLLPKASVSCARINELLDYDCSGDYACDDGSYTARPEPAEIIFSNVSFGYPGAEEVVSDISFTAEAGKTTALIGSTGSGKTTITHLIMGFLRPTSGEIRVGSRPAGDIHLRQDISYAPQKAYVYNDTILNNITMYSDNIDEKRLSDAVHAACLDEVTDRLENGMQNMVQAGGKNLSGGQRQRLSLARALARDTGIYILDDAFSALDNDTEKRCRGRIKDLLQGKTVLMIAQKMDTIRDADRILVLSDGKIAGSGTHEELLKNCREYKEICDTQNYI